jgi:hypothetical protein
MKKAVVSVIMLAVLSACGKSNDQQTQVQQPAEQSQPAQQAPKLANDDPRNLASQMNSEEQLRESRFAMQVAAKSLTDSDWYVYKKAVSDSYASNSTPMNRPLNTEHPYDELTQSDLQKWFDMLPPSLRAPISKQLETASPATALQILNTAFNSRWSDIAKRLNENQAFCRVADTMNPIDFDGKTYSFPVGVFPLGGEATIITSGGKYLSRTPASLVSDTEYNKINSLVSNQGNGLRICWKIGQGHFFTTEQIELGKRGVPTFPSISVELAGTYDIVDKKNGAVMYSFQNNWFFN